MDDESISVAAEDSFAVVNMSSEDRLFVEPELIRALADVADDLNGKWQLTWDFREAGECLYEDVRAAFNEAYDEDSNHVILASPTNRDMIAEALRRRQDRVLPVKAKPLKGSRLELAQFTSESHTAFGSAVYAHIGDYASLKGSKQLSEYIIETNIEAGYWPADDDALTEYGYDVEEAMAELWLASDEYQDIAGLMKVEQSRALDEFLTSVCRTSLLSEIAILATGDKLSVAPYHAESLHRIEHDDGRKSRSVLARPARLHTRLSDTFKEQISQLERMINNPKVRERDIERLLVANPLFLRGLNYQAAYAQVVLPRPGASCLRPDVIVEPVDDEWAHIIELKLPKSRVVVGRPNRASLAAAITSVASQLREYSAFFDDRQMARVVEDKWGFKCYKPKLVAIIGRDPTHYSVEETRRALSSHPDLEIITWDGLLRAARTFMLL